MKNLLLTLSLVLASCVAVQPGNVPIEQDGPVARTIERVLVRTEAYMEMEEPPVVLEDEVKGQVAAAVLVARAMTMMPEASGDMLLVTMAPIMQLHDMMVMMDPALEQLEREIYMEDTKRLASLFSAVSIHAPEPEPAQ